MIEREPKSESVDRVLHRARIYHACRRAIISREWRPGQRLVPNELADEGSTTKLVLEALKILEIEGYLFKTGNIYRVQFWSLETVKLQFQTRRHVLDQSIDQVIALMRSQTVNKAIIASWRGFSENYVSKSDQMIASDDEVANGSRNFWYHIIVASQVPAYLSMYQNLDILCYPRIVTHTLSRDARAETVALYRRLVDKILSGYLETAKALLAVIHCNFIDQYSAYTTFTVSDVETTDTRVTNVDTAHYAAHYAGVCIETQPLTIDLFERDALINRLSRIVAR